MITPATISHHKTNISKCRYDGWKAAESGTSRLDCPHKKHGPERASWMGGYWDFQCGLSIGISRVKGV